MVLAHATERQVEDEEDVVPQPAQFVFRKTDQIGANDASDDSNYLRKCFIDNGYLALLQDIDDPRRLVLGRTGSGKTALLTRLEHRGTTVIRVEPESLSLNHVSNSSMLLFVQQLGVSLDLFFKLLWRHVFVVEVLRRHFESTEHPSSIWSKLESMVGKAKAGSKQSDSARAALKYLKEWGNSFWQETDYRVKEVTRSIEKKLETELAPEISAGDLKVRAGEVSFTGSMTEQQRAELQHRCQSVINHVQMRELTGILELLRDLLDESHTKYFVIIDRLDEKWVDSSIRYLLIRALIETVKDFNKVKRVKIIAALRVDLIERVFRATRDEGFQQEKYESLYLDISWTEPQLLELLDLRVAELIHHRYTKREVRAGEVMPKSVYGFRGPEYLISRTLQKPRDLIMFFNQCIDASDGKSEISAEAVKTAEGAYSRLRLKALADEWAADYPSLMQFMPVLRARPNVIALSDLSDSRMTDLALALGEKPPSYSDEMLACAMRVALGDDEVETLARTVAAVLYKIGFLGVKLEAFESVQWSVDGRRTVSIAELRSGSRLHIHPAFWRALGIGSTTTNSD